METQENNNDLIGEEFIGFKFKSDNILSYSSSYDNLIGCKGMVESVNSSYPQYLYCLMTYANGDTNYYHYPAEEVRKQLEEKEVDIDVLFEQFKNIIH